MIQGFLLWLFLSSEHSEGLVFFYATQSLHFIDRILLKKFLIQIYIQPHSMQ